MLFMNFHEPGSTNPKTSRQRYTKNVLLSPGGWCHKIWAVVNALSLCDLFNGCSHLSCFVFFGSLQMRTTSQALTRGFAVLVALLLACAGTVRLTQMWYFCFEFLRYLFSLDLARPLLHDLFPFDLTLLLRCSSSDLGDTPNWCPSSHSLYGSLGSWTSCRLSDRGLCVWACFILFHLHL